MINIDWDIINCIDYYENEDRCFRLQEYIKKITEVINIKIENYGFAGSTNGGFHSFVKQESLYIKNLVYHYVKYSDILNETFYIDFNAMDLLKYILEMDKLEYMDDDFDFIYTLNEYMKQKRHYRKNLILKREIKHRKLLRTKVISIAIECLKSKAKDIW